MVKTQTRIVLGTRATPKFVTKEFYDAMHIITSTFQYDFTIRPVTIKYKIPSHMVVERSEIYPEYYIEVCDSIRVPLCRKRKILEYNTYKYKQPKLNFDRFRIYTEEIVEDYYLLVPNAQYYDTAIYKEWEVRHLLYNNVLWDIHFKQVFVDPHDTRHNIWFFSQPKYQIELIAEQDFRENELELKNAIMNIIPRAFR